MSLFSIFINNNNKLAKFNNLIISIVLLLAYSYTNAQLNLAENYPTKPIRIIVPVAAGGTVDLVARAIANELTKSFGQTVLVENRPSAASLVGTLAVAHSNADGYTLLATSSTFITASVIIPNAGYDPIKDFVPISITCKSPMLVLINPETTVKNINELVKLAKLRPGEISVASSGNGSTGHIASEVFASRANIKFLNVFYKGNAQAMVDVMGGQANLIFDQLSTAGVQYKTGKLKALAITSMRRSSLFPEIPTISESGYPGYEDVTLNFILAPVGTPKEITAKLNYEIQKIMKNKELVAKFAEKGIELIASPSIDDFKIQMKTEVERVTTLVNNAGIKAD